MVAVPTPRARTSGLTRPSADGPLELNEAMSPVSLAAPQAGTRWGWAGAGRLLLVGSSSCPLLPAAVQQCTPLAVAVLTPMVVTHVWPLRSCCVYQSM